MAQDYLMRFVERVGQMLAVVLAHKQAGRRAEAALEIENSCLQHIGLPMALVRRSSPEALWDLLQQCGGLKHARAVMLAELLLQDADLSRTAGQPADAIRSQLQAFCLLAGSIDALAREETAAYRPRLEALASELERASDDPYLRQKLQAYRVRTRTR